VVGGGGDGGVAGVGGEVEGEDAVGTSSLVCDLVLRLLDTGYWMLEVGSWMLPTAVKSWTLKEQCGKFQGG